jgi:TIR domain/Pentapeptide repeats (8 copies)
VEAWNKWRETSKTHPDLRGAILDEEYFFEADFSGVDFREATLDGSWFLETDLTGADLRGANLIRANLGGAKLGDALLQGANLSFATLDDALLCDAVLAEADLSFANLWGADLTGADMTRVTLGRTVFAETLLQDVEGLDTCIHEGPSVIDQQTIVISDPLPLTFLRGCGLADAMIDFYAKYRNLPAYNSCFVSYSHADKEFAHGLSEALQSRGIRCWLDEKQLLPGNDIYDEVDKGIHLSDKVLLCCSEYALTSWWVDSEIAKAFAKEQKLTKEHGERIQVLIPLDLDGYLFKWQDGKADEVRRRFACNFKNWTADRSGFSQGIDRIVEALRISK